MTHKYQLVLARVLPITTAVAGIREPSRRRDLATGLDRAGQADPISGRREFATVRDAVEWFRLCEDHISRLEGTDGGSASGAADRQPRADQAATRRSGDHAP